MKPTTADPNTMGRRSDLREPVAEPSRKEAHPLLPSCLTKDVAAEPRMPTVRSPRGSNPEGAAALDVCSPAPRNFFPVVVGETTHVEKEMLQFYMIRS